MDHRPLVIAFILIIMLAFSSQTICISDAKFRGLICDYAVKSNAFSVFKMFFTVSTIRFGLYIKHQLGCYINLMLYNKCHVKTSSASV